MGIAVIAAAASATEISTDGIEDKIGREPGATNGLVRPRIVNQLRRWSFLRITLLNDQFSLGLWLGSHNSWSLGRLGSLIILGFLFAYLLFE